MAAVAAAAPNTNQFSSRNASAMISSLDQYPANGGTPMSAAVPMRNTAKVHGIVFLSPPISDMLFVCTAWITEPAARNSNALNAACVNMWNRPAV